MAILFKPEGMVDWVDAYSSWISFWRLCRVARFHNFVDREEEEELPGGGSIMRSMMVSLR